MKHLALALCLVALQQVSDEGRIWPHHPLILPDSKGSVRVEIANPTVKGTVEHDVRHATVTFEWVYEVDGLTTGRGRGKNMTSHLQTCPVEYTPTDVACIDENVVAVAGVEKDGDTILELWTLAPPPTQKVSFTEDGEEVLPCLEVEILQRSVIHRTPSGGKRYIGAVFRNWGDAQLPFVYFTDKSELTALDRRTGERAKVASPTDETVLVAPDLADTRFQTVNSAAHSTLGALYWLYSDTKQGRIVCFVDSDVDGVLDEVDSMVTDRWLESDYVDFESYLLAR